jgi:hypothetical protein
VLELTKPAAAQAVKSRVTADDGSELWSGVVGGVTRVTVDGLHGAYLRVDAEKLPNHVLQDFHLAVIEGLLPLAAPEPAWLLRPAK